MSKEYAYFQDGELIELDDYGCGEHVRGHVCPSEFVEALEEFDDVVSIDITRLRHEYGRWSTTNEPDWAFEFQTYPEPGPGRFPITTLKPEWMLIDPRFAIHRSFTVPRPPALSDVASGSTEKENETWTHLK